VSSLVELERAEGIAIVRINRPNQYNALNRETVDQLDAILESVRQDNTIRALILTGEKNFAAGADIGDMTHLTSQDALAFLFADTFRKLELLPMPTIAAICGYALGGGLEMALACDIRIAAEDAQMGLPEISLGIMPGAGGTVRLPKLVGIGKAKELIFSGRKITAAEACQCGLVQQVVAPADLMTVANELAKKLARQSKTALMSAKTMLNFSAEMPPDAAFKMEAGYWSGLFGTADQIEGMQAFIEKRKPQFNVQK
jgi:enoyl-CoA hydratase/carnithine racemase